MTKQDKISNALIALGHKEVKGYNTSKYRVFKRPADAPHQYYFVGKSGALRAGDAVSDSISIDADRILRRAAR